MRIIKESSQVLIEEKPEYVDHNGVQSRLYKLSNTDKKTGEKKTRYFVKDKDYEPLTVPDNDLNADLPNRANFVAYKQFKTLYNPKDPNTEQYKGKLYPLFVGAKQKDGIEIGKWYKCGTGELRIEVDKTGKPVPGGAIQVDSKLGNLAYRPGWHMGSAPVTRHIGVGASRAKDDHNDYDAMYSENVWAKVEYSGHYDYTDKAKTMPGADKDPKKAMFTDKKDIENGFYHYKTNSNADDSEDWLIADAIKVLSVLKDETVKSIASEHGLKAQNRWEADGSNGNKFYADFSQFEVVESLSKEIRKPIKEDVDFDVFYLTDGKRYVYEIGPFYHLTDDRNKAKMFFDKDQVALVNAKEKFGSDFKYVEKKDIKESVEEDAPYTYKELLKELKSITDNFTDKEGTLKCFYAKEKDLAKQILKKHYKTVEVSGDDRTKGEQWYVIAYSTPISKVNESAEEPEVYIIAKKSPRDMMERDYSHPFLEDEAGKVREFNNLEDATKACKENNCYAVSQNFGELDDVFINNDYRSEGIANLRKHLGKKLLPRK